MNKKKKIIDNIRHALNGLGLKITSETHYHDNGDEYVEVSVIPANKTYAGAIFCDELISMEDIACATKEVEIEIDKDTKAIIYDKQKEIKKLQDEIELIESPVRVARGKCLRCKGNGMVESMKISYTCTDCKGTGIIERPI